MLGLAQEGGLGFDNGLVTFEGEVGEIGSRNGGGLVCNESNDANCDVVNGFDIALEEVRELNELFGGAVEKIGSKIGEI